MKNKERIVLRIRDLEVGFNIDGDYYNAVNGVSFEVGRGKTIGIVGESGCGKSVLAHSILGLLPKKNSKIRNGEIIYKEKEITKIKSKHLNKIRGKEIGIVLQEPMTSLNPLLTIGEQIREVIILHRKMRKKEAMKEVVEILKKVGISRPEKIVKEYPHQLSGGMRQRIVIAIAIACSPEVLIADEPTTALDVTIQAQILDLLKNIQKETNMSLLIISHDLGVIADMCDEVIVMYAGEIVEKGDIKDLFENPKHPYTQKLLKSIPKLDEKKEYLDSIEGIVPPITEMKQRGCRFSERCHKATDICMNVNPKLIKLNLNHEVSCLLYGEKKEGASE